MILNAHSFYSLRYGTIPIEHLVNAAVANKYEEMVLTDINNTTGCLDFVRICKEKGIRPIIGAEFRNDDEKLFYAIAKNNQGFQEINELLTECHLNKTEYPSFAPHFDHCFVVYPFGKKKPEHLKENEFIGINKNQLNKLAFEPRKHFSKFLMQQSVTHNGQKGYELHTYLRAIDHNVLLTQLLPGQYAPMDEYLPHMKELKKGFGGHPELVHNTQMLLDNCQISFDFESVKNKKCFTGNEAEDKDLLYRLTMEGMIYRYGADNEEAKRRIAKELKIINQLGFCAYFPITWDIVRYAMSKGYYCVGRGSGANSVVAFCLRITNVCPIELNLYFERFLNPQRKTPPDFDIDFSWKERDDVTAYIFKKYGSKHVALLGAMGTFQDRAPLRELGKVFGLPKAEIDALVANPNAPLNKSKMSKELLDFRDFMADFPNQRTIHAGGVLISEEPISAYVALDLPPKGFPTTQFDMHVAESIGFEKLDILSQRGIAHIKDAVDMVKENKGIAVDIHNIPMLMKDEGIKNKIRTAKTCGAFYLESPYMRGLFHKLKCDDYLTLVAASSIIRPGVSKSKMMQEYIYRYNNPTKFMYIHPVMEEQLKETYGVMIYQEDVLKIGHHFAGLDLAEADVLRRAMSGKSRSIKQLAAIQAKYFKNCKERGYDDAIAKEVWRQIESFSGYSFCKAHSASYAIQSYQSLYLKAYYPLEFMAAVLNNFGGFYSTRIYIEEARNSGAVIQLPCVNSSQYNSLVKGADLYLGFVHIKSLESKLAETIVEERKQNGHFTGLENFILRVQPPLEQLKILVRIDAFRFSGQTKKELLWEMYVLFNAHKNVSKEERSLFDNSAKVFDLPELEQDKLEDTYDELELLEFPVSYTPFDMLKTTFRGEVMGKDLIKHLGKKVKMVGNFVTMKPVRTSKGQMMCFMTFLDCENHFFDTTHFPDTLIQFPFQGNGVYLILGKVVEEFGFPSLEVEKFARLPLKPDPRTVN